ncbi:DoxX family protein [Pseudomonas sp. DCB_AW]|uniref:HvfX family Cu-binding RiPP maturation protein n=1 Tax=Pseudomonas sp. DCB_AW TaxID=2993596 RepID=UPI0022492BDA|nr:DoxX family protein [Pseudomonas sp. DCB_AW]MCX2687343.1 DoxX family protein [Pseudomonas sp. DCB_AW]
MTRPNMTAFTHPFSHIDRIGNWSADVPLRLFLAWEFFESGLEKYNGTNWFGDLQSSFPFPFSALPAALNWQLSMWAELVLPLLLLLGLGTRLASAGLMVITVVAIAAVHWPAQWSSLAELAQGYAITDQGFGNFKLPLIYLVALLPLLLKGAGRLSLDHWLNARLAARA